MSHISDTYLSLKGEAVARLNINSFLRLVGDRDGTRTPAGLCGPDGAAYTASGKPS